MNEHNESIRVRVGTFAWAMYQIEDQHIVRRSSWVNSPRWSDCYIDLVRVDSAPDVEACLAVCNAKTGVPYCWIPTEFDVDSTDWEVATFDSIAPIVPHPVNPIPQ